MGALPTQPREVLSAESVETKSALTACLKAAQPGRTTVPHGLARGLERGWVHASELQWLIASPCHESNDGTDHHNESGRSRNHVSSPSLLAALLSDSTRA